ALPEQYGGFGDAHSALTGALAAEELGYGDLAIALYLLTPNLFGIPVLHCGTEEQKRQWLPRLTDATFVPVTAALIEPRWDFDPLALHTSAEREYGGYVLNGHKAYVPLAAEAPAILVYAREGGAADGMGSRLGTRQGQRRDARYYTRQAICRRGGAVRDGSRRASTRRSRLHPRTPSRALAARRTWVRGDAWAGDDLSSQETG